MTNIEASPAITMHLKESESDFAVSPEKKREPIRYAIFDSDGTLIDNNKKHRKIFINYTHQILGISKEVAWDHYVKVAGRRTSYQVDSLLDKLGLDIGSTIVTGEPGKQKRRELTEKDINKLKAAILEQRSKAKGRAFPELRGTLRTLKFSEGVVLGVSTGSKVQDTINKLRYAGILDYFKVDTQVTGGKTEYAVVGRDSFGPDTPIKKGREHFQLLSYIFSVPYTTLVKQSVFISDTLDDHDEIGTELPMVRRVGIADAAHTRAELLQAELDTVRNPKEYSHLPSIFRFL